MPIKAGILHPSFPDQESPRTAESCPGEAVSLAMALGFTAAFRQVVRLRSVNSVTLFGSGRCESLKQEIDAANASAAVADGSISPVQPRNLEKLWDVRVLDRTGLILEIFACRAQIRGSCGNRGSCGAAIIRHRYGYRITRFNSFMNVVIQRCAAGRTGTNGIPEIQTGPPLDPPRTSAGRPWVRGRIRGNPDRVRPARLTIGFYV